MFAVDRRSVTNRPHDALFRSAFEQPEHAAAELRAVLPVEVAAAIDWSTLVSEPGSFVDLGLRDRHCDLLFSARIGEARVLLYLLLEHQSSADPLMPLRMLIYLVRIWERWVREHEGERLPAIVPVVVSHTGAGWTAPTSMHGLVDPAPADVPGLAPLVPGFEIVVDDLDHTSNEQLRGRALAHFPVLALWLLRDSRTIEALLANLDAWADAFVAVAHAPSGLEALIKLVRYLDLVLSEQQYAEIRAKLIAIAPATAEAVMTHAERLIQEGHAKGRADGQREALLKLLALKFGTVDDACEARVRTAGSEELERWLERILSARRIDEVFAP